jgi:hypothetical protein
MKDGRPNDDDRESPRRRLSDRKDGSPRRQRGYVERATAQGHSGRGSASVLPHLRDQLRLKALLPSPFPMPEDEGVGKDEHHQ